MGSKRKFAFFAPLALLACAAPAESNPMSAERLSCHLTGEKWTGASEEDLCRIFSSALRNTDAGNVARIELEALSADTARATAFDEDDAIVGESNLSVMDRQIGRSSWETLARGLAHAIAKGKS